MLVTLFLFVVVLVVVFEFTFAYQQNLFLNRIKTSLSIHDYLHTKLTYFSSQSIFSDQLVKRSEIEEEARKLLDLEHYQKFRNEVDDTHIKISQTLISRIFYRFLLLFFVVYMPLERVIFGDYLFKTYPQYRLIITVLYIAILMFYLISVIRKIFVLIRFKKQVSKQSK